MIQNRAVRYGLFVLWVAIAAGALYLYFFQREAVQAEMRDALSASFWVASISYLVIGALRPLTLVPATFPLLVAMPFFDPWVLLALTLPCIAISSAICYWFAEALHLDELVERKYPSHIRRLKALLQSYQLPIIIGWSFMLFLPTDVLCYVCGSLKINFKKFLVGVLIGEGAVYAIYIFLGDWVLRT
ncbi:MAG TPA: VTT domain-containing protein [Vicinamibacterales bacterium]|nr:VTT domain-containing protein [Vicinamibacterales bacterium]